MATRSRRANEINIPVKLSIDAEEASKDISEQVKKYNKEFEKIGNSTNAEGIETIRYQAKMASKDIFELIKDAKTLKGELGKSVKLEIDFDSEEFKNIKGKELVSFFKEISNTGSDLIKIDTSKLVKSLTDSYAEVTKLLPNIAKDLKPSESR